MPPKLFGTSGIRGPAQTLFTNDFCIRAGFVFGEWLNRRGKTGFVAVAMDPRESSPRIKNYVLRGLASAGWEILDEGVIPTPALTLFVKNSPHVGGGIMITGSHITADLNGLKLLVDGEEVSKDHEKEIESIFEQFEKKQVLGIDPIVKFESAGLEMYVDMLKGIAKKYDKKWKVVLDTANGAQTDVFRQLFSDWKINVNTIGESNIQSPHFVPRDTEVSSHFAELSRQVLLQKADLGIGFDVDGDRVIFIDDLGRFVPGDYTCSLIARDSDTNVIVTPVSSSSVVDKLGKKVFRTPVGSTRVVAKMKEVGSSFGFEANGGGISAEISYGRDGGSTAVKLMNILATTNDKLSSAYDSLPKYFLYRDKTDCPFDKYEQIYNTVKAKFAKNEKEEIDGVKVYFTPDEWMLFRGSGNAPEFRVFTQSRDEKRANALGHEGMQIVKDIVAPHPVEVHSKVKSDSMQVEKSIFSFASQCEQVIGETSLLHIPPECGLVNNIVVSGMGGSALGARIISNLERHVLRVPLVVSTEYHLPNFVNSGTLVVISSYSGNTEESLASLQEAISRNAQIFIITSGGILAEKAELLKLPRYIFDPKFNPSGQPRLGLGYNLLALFHLLARCQLIHSTSKLSQLPKFLKSLQAAQSEQATLIAQKLVSRIPVILASEHLKGVAHDFKNQLNENSKTFATYFDIPEANHHLLEGLSFPKNNSSNLIGIFLESTKYQAQIINRYELTKTVFQKQRIPCITLTADGEDTLFEAMSLLQLAAMIAYELSQLNNVDPGPIPWVDYFKDELKR